MNEFSDIFGELLHGVLPFSAVENRLLNVRAASRLPKDAKSVICVLFPYYIGENNYNNINISRYAVMSDYHEICGAKLADFTRMLSAKYTDNTFVPFADKSPIPEVFAAVGCGLGIEGKNTLLINEKYGSWVFIGEIVTDLAVKCALQPHKSCENCGLCAAACPSGALSDGFCREKCISHITQKKGLLTAAQQQLLRENGSAWGCDICQRVCPHNAAAALSPVEEFYAGLRAHVRAGDSLDGRAYAWRGKEIIQRNLGLLVEKSER